MKKSSKLDSSRSFTYLDAFLLLLVGLLISLGIDWMTEENRQEKERPVYQVEVSACYRSEIQHVLPQKGEVLFNERGEPSGEVLKVEHYEEGGKKMILLTFQTKEHPGQKGNMITVETAKSRNTATVLAVTETERSDSK